MRSKYILFFILVLFGTTLNAQTTGGSDTATVNEDSTYSETDRMAEFPGGDMEFNNYIATHFKYPVRCWEKNISCRVVVRFVVGTDGKVADASMIDKCDRCPEIDAEAIRVILSSPKWKPAVYNGKKVKAWRQVPITLKLE